MDDVGGIVEGTHGIIHARLFQKCMEFLMGKMSCFSGCYIKFRFLIKALFDVFNHVKKSEHVRLIGKFMKEYTY